MNDIRQQIDVLRERSTRCGYPFPRQLESRIRESLTRLDKHDDEWTYNEACAVQAFCVKHSHLAMAWARLGELHGFAPTDAATNRGSRHDDQ
jgi:hypothetical protein